MENKKPSQITNGYWIYAISKKKYPEPADNCGKWMIFGYKGEQLDSIWEGVKKAVEKGLLGSSAKCSTAKQIVTEFFDRFLADGSNIWDFVPIGIQLNFEWEFIISKSNKYLDKKLVSRDLHYSRPYIDIKSILVLLNNGNFKGASLSNFTDKSQDWKVIKNYYEKRQFDKIENYIINETNAFFVFLQK